MLNLITGRELNHINLTTEKEGLHVLKEQVEGFHIPSKEDKKYQQYIEWRLYISEGGKLLKTKPFTPEGVHTVMGMIWK